MTADSKWTFLKCLISPLTKGDSRAQGDLKTAAAALTGVTLIM